MLPCVCSVIDHRWRQNVVRTKVAHEAIALCVTDVFTTFWRLLWSITYYIITQVILAFWLVLAYDLLEDRRTIDVITAKLFPQRFKMAESFENLDCRGVEQVREAERRKIKPFLSYKTDSEKILKQSQSAVEWDLTRHKICLGKPRTIAVSRI